MLTHPHPHPHPHTHTLMTSVPFIPSKWFHRLNEHLFYIINRCLIYYQPLLYYQPITLFVGPWASWCLEDLWGTAEAGISCSEHTRLSSAWCHPDAGPSPQTPEKSQRRRGRDTSDQWRQATSALSAVNSLPWNYDFTDFNMNIFFILTISLRYGFRNNTASSILNNFIFFQYCWKVPQNNNNNNKPSFTFIFFSKTHVDPRQVDGRRVVEVVRHQAAYILYLIKSSYKNSISDQVMLLAHECLFFMAQTLHLLEQNQMGFDQTPPEKERRNGFNISNHF